MRTFDLSPLYRNTVGFDRLFSLLDSAGNVEGGAPTYPPYNIERTGENAYRVTVAVAGFTPEELSIEVKENTLSLRGEKAAQAAAKLRRCFIAALPPVPSSADSSLRTMWK